MLRHRFPRLTKRKKRTSKAEVLPDGDTGLKSSLPDSERKVVHALWKNYRGHVDVWTLPESDRKVGRVYGDYRCLRNIKDLALARV